MSTLSLRIPESLHRRIKKLASEDKISINQFINSALAEKISALETNRYLEGRAKRGDVKRFKEVLEKIPDKEPESFDKLN
ncbi:MAG: toxin-antitoxin system HicB family antitoxin [bacterium]